MSQALEKQKAELEKISKGPDLPAAPASLPTMQIGEQGLQLRDLNEAYRFASIVWEAQMAPKSLDSPAKILIAMQMGLELGMTPMAAIQNIAVINGRPSLWGDGMLGVVRASGLFDEEAFKEWWDYDPSGKPLEAHCTVRRKPNGNPITQSFSWQEAVSAKLNDKDSPWRTYPKRMMMMRARGFALRDAFADVLRGMPIAEELQGEPAEKNVTPPAKPTNLEELTEQLTSPAEPVAAAAEEAKPVEQAEESPVDPLAALRREFEECAYVSDAVKLRDKLTGPKSVLSDEQKSELTQFANERIEQLKELRQTKKQQPMLP